jgi:ribosomal protein L37AE/L43A
VWNLAVEQLSYRAHSQRVPGYVEQSKQLTEARAAFGWLAAGSQTVQQQALRDFDQAVANWRGGTHRRPGWRKRGRHEGFRIVGPQAQRVEKLNRRWSRVNTTRSARGTRAEPGRNVRQKAGLNRSILNGGWSLFATRIGHKAAGRVEQVNPAFTSQRCSVCSHVARESRKSQALFLCTACGHTSNADLNAARNIAAGRAVTARGATGVPVTVNREPQHVTPPPAA